MVHPLISPTELPSPGSIFLNFSTTLGRLRKFSLGETVYEPGVDEFVGYLMAGTVKLVILLPDGRTNIVGVIEAPGLVGGVHGVTTEFATEAASDVIVACLDQAIFDAKLRSDPGLERFVHLENLHQLEEAHEHIIILACQSVMERMATFLLLKMLAGPSNGGNGDPGMVHIPINRRDFAAYLGTTVESVSRSIQALARRGTIAIIDSSNFRVLRRRDLFDISRQDEQGVLEMVRSRESKRHAGWPAFALPERQSVPAAMPPGDGMAIAAQ